MSLKVTTAAVDPAATSGTTVRFLFRGSSDPTTDMTITGVSSSGVDGSASRYVDVLIPAKPPSPGFHAARPRSKPSPITKPSELPEVLVLHTIQNRSHRH